MDSLEKKEKNLQKLIEKLSVVTTSYSQPLINNEKIQEERNQLDLEKKELEKRNLELAREHQYLKNKLIKLQSELNKKSEAEDQFNQDIDELGRETESLVEEIDKWQT